MRDLSYNTDEELSNRASDLLDELDILLKEVGPKLDKIGRLRYEVAVIQKELEKRNAK